jgi:aminopeptidase-like protein
LDSDAYDGLHLVFPPGGFQSLKKLSVNLGKLKNVQIGRLALTRLEDLQISYYPDKPEVKVEIHGKDKVVNKIKRGNKELSKKIKHIPDSSGQSSEQGQRSSLCYTPISENLM